MVLHVGTVTSEVKPRAHPHGAAIVVATLLAAATLASFLGALWWGFELLSSFRPQWAALSLLLLAIALAFRSFVAIALCLACLLAHLAPLAPYLLSRHAPAATAPTLRVLTANLHGRNADTARFAALIARERPDVVLLTEVPADFARIAAGLTPPYPHVVMERLGANQVIMLSRWAIGATSGDRRPRLSQSGVSFNVVAMSAARAGTATPVYL